MRLIHLSYYLSYFTAALLVAANVSAADCPSVPEGIRDIKAQGYYTDSAHSVVNEEQRSENLEMTKPFNDYMKQVAGMSDEYLAKQDVAAGKCAIAWLNGWAHDGAMLGKMIHVNNDQADYMRAWVHGSVAIAYLKTKDLATAEQRAQIEPWLKELAGYNLAYWDNPKKTRNNHYYWSGLGIMATGVATGDKTILSHALGIYEKGINDIQDDGSLPLEMRRGKRAFHYHNYALAPLVLMAEMGRLIGQDLYAYQNHRINLLAERVASGYRDNAWFAEQSGVKQETAKPDGEAGWVEFYRLRSNHPEIFEDLHQAGPFEDPRMGGNLSLMARVGITAPVATAATAPTAAPTAAPK